VCGAPCNTGVVCHRSVGSFAAERLSSLHVLPLVILLVIVILALLFYMVVRHGHNLFSLHCRNSLTHCVSPIWL